MVVYMKVSKDDRMQNVVFQYNESQSSAEKYICFPTKYFILFSGWTITFKTTHRS